MRKIIASMLILVGFVHGASEVKVESEKRFVTDVEVRGLCKQLVTKLPDQPWTGLVAITRGGLVPTANISHILKIRRIEALNIVSYTDDKEQTQLQFLNEPPLGDGAGWLFVDELTDTGTSFKLAKEKYPNGIFVALFAKEKGKEFVDYYVEEANVWLVFPWEKD